MQYLAAVDGLLDQVRAMGFDVHTPAEVFKAANECAMAVCRLHKSLAEEFHPSVIADYKATPDEMHPETKATLDKYFSAIKQNAEKEKKLRELYAQIKAIPKP
jgi:hypothetical protein